MQLEMKKMAKKELKPNEQLAKKSWKNTSQQT